MLIKKQCITKIEKQQNIHNVFVLYGVIGIWQAVFKYEQLVDIWMNEFISELKSQTFLPGKKGNCTMKVILSLYGKLARLET